MAAARDAVDGLNWIATGTAPSTVLLIHAVGYDLTYWDQQIEALRNSFTVIAFDLPGHGRSAGDAGDCTFDRMVEVIVRLLSQVDRGPVHVVGISFGGMIAQYLVLARPDLVRSLTLIGAASRFADAARVAMRARAKATRDGGMQAVLQSSLERWFTPETWLQRPDIMDRVSKTVLGDNPEVHAAIWDLIATFDVDDRLDRIGCPVLVMVGELDQSTPVSAAVALKEGIRNARLVVLADTSHMATVESPAAVNAELMKFLTAH